MNLTNLNFYFFLNRILKVEKVLLYFEKHKYFGNYTQSKQRIIKITKYHFVMKTLHIKVFHDTVCPWCRIGKKNLLTALEELGKSPEEIDISYLTFFLNRDIPVEGVDYVKYLTDTK